MQQESEITERRNPSLPFPDLQLFICKLQDRGYMFYNAGLMLGHGMCLISFYLFS